MLITVNVGHLITDVLPFVIDSLIEIGAENVQAIPTITKKGRPGFILFIDAEKALTKPISEFLMRELGIIGLRVLKEEQHIKFDYEIRTVEIQSNDLPKVPIMVKCIRDRTGEIASVHAEHEEIKNALNILKRKGKRISFKGLKEIVEVVALHRQPIDYQGLEIRIGSH